MWLVAVQLSAREVQRHSFVMNLIMSPDVDVSRLEKLQEASTAVSGVF